MSPTTETVKDAVVSTPTKPKSGLSSRSEHHAPMTPMTPGNSSPQKSSSSSSSAAAIRLHETQLKAERERARNAKEALIRAKTEELRTKVDQLKPVKGDNSINGELKKKTKDFFQDVRKRKAEAEAKLPFNEKIKTKKFLMEHSKLLKAVRVIGIPSMTKEASDFISQNLSKAIGGVIKTGIVHTLHDKKMKISQHHMQSAIRQIRNECHF